MYIPTLHYGSWRGTALAELQADSAVSQIERTVKASILDLKKAFFAKKCYLFAPNRSLSFEKDRGTLLQKRTNIEWPSLLDQADKVFCWQYSLCIGTLVVLWLGIACSLVVKKSIIGKKEGVYLRLLLGSWIAWCVYYCAEGTFEFFWPFGLQSLHYGYDAGWFQRRTQNKIQAKQAA